MDVRMQKTVDGKERKQMEAERTALFRCPTGEYRGVPFWAWNGKLTEEELSDQLKMFQTMGFGGVHIHSRTGLETGYLSEEYMNLVQFSLEEGRKYGLRVWLYDEDRWPSGSAGGKVTADERYRTEYLLFTPYPYGECRCEKDCKRKKALLPGRGGARHENGTLLGRYDVVLGEDGMLQNYRLLLDGETAQGVTWYAYLEKAVPSQWFNNQTYLNVLDEESVRRFTEVTHDEYAKYFSDKFGSEIPAIFTDEPQHVFLMPLQSAHEKKCVFFPWTHGFDESFQRTYGFSILERLPELFWEKECGISYPRYAYHNHVADLFADNFVGTLSSWCRNHALKLTGHLMWEPTLQSQTTFVGDVMRCYPGFDIPGIDILCDAHEYNTAKQAQSIVHQTGADGMISELYGETGWDFDFRGHKLQGDWQAALGVTVRVPHLSWLSMKGEAKRDYPAAISAQSPWWERYSYVETYFARVNTLMMRGKALVSIGVLHPIESFYLHMGPESETSGKRGAMDAQFAHLTELLLFHQLDFDFINEAALLRIRKEEANPLTVGEMQYEVIVLYGCETIRRSTLSFLEEFRKAGGKLLFVGGCPMYVEAGSDPDDCRRMKRLYEGSNQVRAEDAAILEALHPYRFLQIETAGGTAADYLLHQIREDEEERLMLIARGKNPVSADVDDREKLKFSIRGEYQVLEYDAQSGEIRRIPAAVRHGKTYFERVWFLHDSLLLRLLPLGSALPESDISREIRSSDLLLEQKSEPMRHLDRVKVQLEEPNACLLDLAEFSLDGLPFEPTEEILRLDNLLRERLGLPKQSRDVVQPYARCEEKTEHTVTLRFSVWSEVESLATHLALEEPDQAVIRLNGETVRAEPVGYYVDRAIEKVPLPPLLQGKNILEVTVPFGRNTFTEWCYLLGDFSVRLDGIHKTLQAPVRSLAFGDIVMQGLPFYTGNLTYSYEFEASGDVLVRVPRYRGAALGIRVDKGAEETVAFSPYTCHVKIGEPGRHTLSITLYNTRQNGFGPVHHTDSIPFPQHPNSWRSTKDRWTYEYQLRRTGILASPEIYPLQETMSPECV